MTLNSRPRLLSLSINFVLAKAAPGVKTPPLEDNNETTVSQAGSALPLLERSDLRGLAIKSLHSSRKPDSFDAVLGSFGFIPKTSQ